MNSVTTVLFKKPFSTSYLKNILFLSILFLSTSLFSQQKVQYVFSETTESAIGELRFLLKNDEEKISNVILKIKDLESQGKIILSSSEYAPIKTRIESVVTTPVTETEIELKAYADAAKKRYVVITELLK